MRLDPETGMPASLGEALRYLEGCDLTHGVQSVSGEVEEGECNVAGCSFVGCLCGRPCFLAVLIESLTTSSLTLPFLGRAYEGWIVLDRGGRALGTIRYTQLPPLAAGAIGQTLTGWQGLLRREGHDSPRATANTHTVHDLGRGRGIQAQAEDQRSSQITHCGAMGRNEDGA